MTTDELAVQGLARRLGLRTSKRYDSHMSSTAPEPAASPEARSAPADSVRVKFSEAIGTMKAQLARTAGDPNASAADIWMCAILLVGAAECFAEAAPPPPSATGELAANPSLPCTGCVIDIKQGLALGRDRAKLPDPLPGTVMINGMLLCDIRHQLNVGTPPPPSLLIAPADALPGRMLA